LSLYLRAPPDTNGNFVFEKVPPGERKVYLEYRFRDGPGVTPLSHGTPVTIKPGQTTEVLIGGTGRPVTGQIAVVGGDAADIDWRRDVHTLTLSIPDNPENKPPDISRVTTNEERQKIWKEHAEKQKAFWQSEKGRALDRAQRSYVLVFTTNGSFRADNVPGGTYDLNVSPTDPQEEYYRYQPLGTLHKVVVIPEANGGAEPFDLGRLELQTRRNAKVGQLAPTFETKTLDGKNFKLADYRGKFVLLDFSATWAGPRIAELATLKSIHGTYGKDARFVMVGLNFDNDANIAAEFVRTNDLKWLQCYVGQWSQTQVPASFGLQGLPVAVLIDPAGKIISKNLHGNAIRTAVRNALTDPKKLTANPSAAPNP
jgi:thiol-disulfide isomerase/thioredoxin